MAPTQFGKPKAKTGDGNFKFKLPDTIGSGRGRIAKGPRIGRCTDIVFEHSKSSNNPMWTWTFVITKGPDAGRDFKLWTVLTDDAAWKIVETMKALGIEVEAGDEINISRKDVIGVGCTMHIKDDNGRDGDGEFSKLDKISAHPNGAGFRAGGGIAAKKVEEEEQEETDNIEELHNAPSGVDDDGEEQWACSHCDFEGTEEEVNAHLVSEHDEEPDPVEEKPAPPPRRRPQPPAAPPARRVATPPARGKAPATVGRGPKKR